MFKYIGKELQSPVYYHVIYFSLRVVLCYRLFKYYMEYCQWKLAFRRMSHFLVTTTGNPNIKQMLEVFWHLSDFLVLHKIAADLRTISKVYVDGPQQLLNEAHTYVTTRSKALTNIFIKL